MKESSRMTAYWRFIFCLYFSFVIFIEMVNSLAYDVGKLNTKMTKMKNTLTRHNTKEQSKVSAQVLLPKFIDKAKNAVGRLNEEEYDNGLATFELLVRRTQTGPWYRYQDLLGTELISDYVENVILGGLEAETWRMKLDNWISLQIFGKGTGSESITKVKQTLIQFKKLKPREFEFGYRIAVDGETVYSVEKSMKEEIFIPKSRSPSMARVNVTDVIAKAQNIAASSTSTLFMRSKGRESAAEVGDLAEAVIDVVETEIESDDRKDLTIIDSSISALNEVVLQFYDNMEINEADGCLFFSDGSATLSEDGLGCATACCGVFLLPTINNIPIYSISESIRVDSAGGMIDSPFDAELIAGLSAVTLAKLMAKIITTGGSGSASKVKNNEEADKARFEVGEDGFLISDRTIHNNMGSDSSDSGDIMSNIYDDNDTITDSKNTELTVSMDSKNNMKKKIEFTLHTDSKTLTRAIRTGPKGDLADRASPSRLAMWKQLSSHMGELSALGMPVTVEWIPGHPERRDMDRSRWSVRDIGIWMADEIAKIETNEVSATFINSKVESNNNKILVRDPEKQAKFPKKVALKSPKKTGVKKKNYYNTKLTFSKDPRNPKVEAAKNDTLSSENIATELSDELAELDLLGDLLGKESTIEGCDEVEGNEGGEGNGGNNDDGMEMSVSDSDTEVMTENNGENENDENTLENRENEDNDDNKGKEETEESMVIGDEMEDVNVFERKEIEAVEAVEEAATTMPVSVISAVDMIALSTFLSV